MDGGSRVVGYNATPQARLDQQLATRLDAEDDLVQPLIEGIVTE